jgi:hypothetical protein
MQLTDFAECVASQVCVASLGAILWAQQDRRIAALDRVSIRDIALSSACALAVSKFMLVRIGQSAVVRFSLLPC